MEIRQNSDLKLQHTLQQQQKLPQQLPQQLHRQTLHDRSLSDNSYNHIGYEEEVQSNVQLAVL